MITFIIGAMIESPDFLQNTITGFSDESFIIACDKGYEHLCELKIKADVIIGDFDSASKEVTEEKAHGAAVIKLNPIKDDTDTEAALRYALEHTNGDIIILGALGGRIDHSLGNIALLGMGLKAGRKVYILDSLNRLQMLQGGQKLIINANEQYGKYVSVFPYQSVASGVTMEGFKYPLRDAKIEGFNTLTVSNEIVDATASISIESGFLLVCECAD